MIIIMLQQCSKLCSLNFIENNRPTKILCLSCLLLTCVDLQSIYFVIIMHMSMWIAAGPYGFSGFYALFPSRVLQNPYSLCPQSGSESM